MRWALPATVAVCALLWVDALAGGGLAGGLPALLVVAVLAALAGRAATAAALVPCCVGSATLLAVADQVASPGRFSIGSDGVFYLVVLGAPALLGWLIASRSRQVAALERSRRALEARRAVAVRLAREEERARVQSRIDVALAARLREIVTASRSSHELAGSAPEAVPAQLVAVEDTARAALAELREVLGILQPETSEAPETVVPTAAPPPVAAPALDRRLDLVLVLATVPVAVETASPGHHGFALANVALALAQGVALSLLRRRPILGTAVMFGIAAVQSAVFAALPPTVSWLLPGLLAAYLIGHARRHALGALAVAVAGDLLVTFVTPRADHPTSGLVPGLVMALLAAAAGWTVARYESRAAQLRAIGEELERTRDQQARLSAFEQRAELARDLHDVGAHALTAVCLQASAARAWWDRDPTRARSAVDDMHSVADDTLAALGASFGELAESGASRGAAALTRDSLDALAGLSRALGLRVALTIVGDLPGVPAQTAQVAYRVVQEALTNAARHAGRTTVDVRLGAVDGRLDVRITDAGPVPDAAPAGSVPGAGLGLRGMRERVEALRGELTAGRCGDGFEVCARLPA